VLDLPAAGGAQAPHTQQVLLPRRAALPLLHKLMEAHGFGVEQEPLACQEPAAWLNWIASGDGADGLGDQQPSHYDLTSDIRPGTGGRKSEILN